MEFVEALQEFLSHQGFQKIKYDSKILWGKIQAISSHYLKLFRHFFQGSRELIETKRRRNARYRTPDYAKVSEKVEHLLLILNKENQILKKEKKRKNIQIYGFLI